MLTQALLYQKQKAGTIEVRISASHLASVYVVKKEGVPLLLALMLPLLPELLHLVG